MHRTLLCMCIHTCLRVCVHYAYATQRIIHVQMTIHWKRKSYSKPDHTFVIIASRVALAYGLHLPATSPLREIVLWGRGHLCNTGVKLPSLRGIRRCQGVFSPAEHALGSRQIKALGRFHNDSLIKINQMNFNDFQVRGRFHSLSRENIR